MEWLKSEVNTSGISLLNQSEVTDSVYDLYEAYKETETQRFVVFKIVAYFLGTIIFLSNLIVVISSGLILRTGQRLKSTYLILGNVSLADTIVGISIIVGVSIESLKASNLLCIFQIGMLVCPAMVSIFSVGLIAVDRYIYIVHGLYYQRWFNTTKVRIGILCIWLVAITLGFLPIAGLVNTELSHTQCYYVSLFPGSLILLNSLLSIVPVILVAILYSIILVKALQNVKEIKASIKIVNKKNNKPEMRINRGNAGYLKNTVQSVKLCNEKPTIGKINDDKGLKRSASFNGNCKNDFVRFKFNELCHKSKSNDDIPDNRRSAYKNCIILTDSISQDTYESNISVFSINSSMPDQIDIGNNRISQKIDIENRKRKNVKVKEPNKWRAIIVVMLTSGSFIFTWMPFFITVIFYVLCQEKLTNQKCFQLRSMVGGPMATLAFLNSILNPLIYAWWHKGFQKSIKMYFRKYFCRYFQKNEL